MLLGWPATILLILIIGAIVVLYMRADAIHRQRKLDIVRKRLADIEARKQRETHKNSAPEDLTEEQERGGEG